MKAHNVIELNQRLHRWMEQYSPELEKDIAQWVRKHAIDPTDDLARSFSLLEEENRLLQIGVVGRVKAGKSSLLNALVFDGHVILPRAATPMTAALTTLTYGETFAATVQFYDAADQANIKQNAARYEKRLKEEEGRAADSLRQRRKAKGQMVEDDQFWADVKKAARSALQGEHTLVAAYDQWRSICECNLDPIALDSLGQLEAVDAASLAKQLNDYVASGGTYMPLTKSVDIFLPLESLRNIRIIDTPGLNDPVQSREERTSALLKDCDVVFIVSPAGQFLSEQDTEMMSRITQKEGVQELVLIASQVDNQLYGSEIRQSTLHGALDTITTTLSAHMIDTLRRLKVRHPEMGGTFDSLIQDGAGKVLLTSGMCHSLSVRFDQQEGWDSSERKAWENLQSFYPDFFTPDHPERCCTNLDLLANTATLRGVLEKVRAQKDRIIEQRQVELIRAKSKALEAFRSDLLAFTQAKYHEVKNADIEDLKAQRRKLDGLMTVATYELDEMLAKCIAEFQDKLKKKLSKELESAYGGTGAAFEIAGTESSSKHEVVRDSVFAKIANWGWGGGKETITHTEFKLFWRKVYNELEAFAEEVVQDLMNTTESLTVEFRQQLIKESTGVARRHLEDNVDPALIIRTNQGLVSNFKLPDFELDTHKLEILKRTGTQLLNSEARDYLDEAVDCLDNFKGDAKKQIRHLIDDIKTALPSSYGNAYFQDMQERMRQLEEQVENTLLTLDRLQRMTKDLESL